MAVSFFGASPKKSVRSVMEVFHRTLSDLEEVEQQSRIEAEMHAQRVYEAKLAMEAAEKEAADAASTRAKLAAIVNP